MSVDEIQVPQELAEEAVDHLARQDAERGPWPSPRSGADVTGPPYPAPDNPVLGYLVAIAHSAVDSGADVRETIVQLAVHAWMEGHVEGYDRGQRAARDADAPKPGDNPS
jgi:hypothetical protein